MDVVRPPKPAVPPGFRDAELRRHATDTAGEAWVLIAELFLQYGKPRMMRAGQELELSPPQAIVLRLLDQPRPMGELAASMHCDSSNMTGIVDRLEERRLVQRTASEHDRRVKLIALTDAGRGLRDQLNRRLAEAPEALVTLPEEDQLALRDILRRAVDG